MRYEGDAKNAGMENADLKMRDQTACVENVTLENADQKKRKGIALKLYAIRRVVLSKYRNEGRAD